MTNRGTTCMFVGYSVDHSNSFESKQIINSRDVVWLGKNFKIWSKSKFLSEIHELDDDDDLLRKLKN